MHIRRHIHATDLHGASRLAFDATLGITNLVEAMHRNIASVSGVIGPQPEGNARGISGMVYRAVRGTTQLLGSGVEFALAQLVPVLGKHDSSPQREATLSALNGIIGDYLAESGNPLALDMQFRVAGEALALNRESLAAAFPKASNKIVILVHGLCMNDQQWMRDGHDHGAALSVDLGYTPVYLRYNTGLHISSNGCELAMRVNELVAAWPVPLQEITIVGHSMGGLVTRSALYYAQESRYDWISLTKNLMFLGTPHHGAPLERGGHWIDALLDVSPYVAPFARIGQLRSAGITDLRHSNLLDEDWHGRNRFKRTTSRPKMLPLPASMGCFAIAAAIGNETSDLNYRLLGDGLVPVDSALGRHKNKKYDLAIPIDRRWICYELNHMDLLSSIAVYAQIHCWLKDRSM